jgi:hypothetical protein
MNTGAEGSTATEGPPPGAEAIIASKNAARRRAHASRSLMVL